FDYMASCIDEDGLYGFWPGSRGTVSLTAYAVEFLVACRAAGMEPDPKLLDRPVTALSNALRSDYARLLSDWSSYERVEAFAALDAAGRFDNAYANDLLSISPSLPLYSKARLYVALHRHGLADTRKGRDLGKTIASSLVTRKEGNRQVLVGVQPGSMPWGGIVLSSELKTIAAVTEAVLLIDPKSPKLATVADYLVAASGAAGWGNTSDNVAGMRAMKALLGTTAAGGGEIVLEITSPRGTRRVTTGPSGLGSFALDDPGPVKVVVRKGAVKGQPASFLLTTDYVPVARGTTSTAENAGFLVQRDIATFDAGGQGAGYHAVKAGVPIELPLDTVVEEHVRVVNFENQSFVAVTVPIAAGLEPLNPNLAGAPPEATPRGRLTAAPTYSTYGDDAVTYYYNSLPKGTYDFYFRVRASFSGSFTEPSATAVLLYALDVRGRSEGCELVIPADGGK
ncbi:MAG TPA: hypothetical protein VHE79_03085, partial [Spirochaetia bacterium]